MTIMVKKKDPLREAMYQRSRGLYDPDSVPRVHVVGVGGIGAWVGYALAIAGVKEIHVYDDDRLEGHNLNRLPYGLNDIGSAKTEAVARLIATCRPDTKVVQHGRVTGPESMKLKKTDVVVVAVDSAEQNNLVVKAAKKKGCRVVRGAYDGDRITISDGAHQFGSGQGGYRIVPSYVATPMVVAGLLVEKVFRTKNLNIDSEPLGKLR